MKFIRTYIAFTDKLVKKVGEASSWCALVLVLLICLDVFLRYVLNKSYAALFEFEWYVFSFLFLMGGAYAFQKDKHVRVDVFYTHFSEKGKAMVNLLGVFILLLPFLVVLIYHSIDFTLVSLKILESSPDPGGLPYRFLVNAFLPISLLLLAMQALSEGFKSIIILKEN